MMKSNALTLVTLCWLFAGADSAAAAEDHVTVKGYVTDLQGRPHNNSDITIRVSSVDKQIDARKAKPDGSFSFSIDPASLPSSNATLQFTASGRAFLNGDFVDVTTNGTLFGLSGRGDATLIPTTQFVLLVVPKANRPAAPCCARRVRFCHRRR